MVKVFDDIVEVVKVVDEIVLVVLMYNFGILLSLKVYFDCIVRVGIIFKYIEIGFVGLLENKLVIVFVVCGGVYVGLDFDM